MRKSFVPQTNIYPCPQGHGTRGDRRSGEVIKTINGTAICHNRPGESQFSTQDILKQEMVPMTIHPINFIVSRHNSLDAFIAAGFHHRKMNFPQFTRTNTSRTGINAPGGLPLRAEMLGHNRYALFPASPYNSTGHLCGKIGILPKAFFAASPTGIAQHIQHGNQRIINPQIFHLFSG